VCVCVCVCVGEFGAGLGDRVCAVCGTVWFGFGGMSVCVSVCVWDRLVWVCGSECELCVVEFCVGLGE